MKKSLIGAIFNTSVTKESYESPDERVVTETNRIFTNAYAALTAVMSVIGIVLDTVGEAVRPASAWIFIAIGLVSYICLLVMCKKALIERNLSVYVTALWCFLLMPLTLYNVIIDVATNALESYPTWLAIGVPVGCIAFSAVLYFIANAVYKKNC